MLDKETKNKIDDLRQILVGKVTDPRSQVEQITNALLYKFMNDMDEESISLGGVPSYFTNEYKKYSWKILLDIKTSGEDRVKIYSEGIEKMYLNENLPQTFREIFKNSTLPFKEVKVFNKFITRINDFKYSNSESLGDAFEYLLSFMGKQGDAGQFRTPRHIIDFIVDLVNPGKKDRILDPSSGTAGFLISAYKYILNQNKKKIPGDLLNSDDRKNIANNLNGYDISPEFLKVSLMNMFLHKFNNPNIFEYDTLSDENKWNEYFDVILANPPFFSPKGGITPHNRFSIKSKRAEVLFTDYIDEHLKPNGRAGIIVPEGVIFRNDAGYRPLRVKLIKNSLVGIISLPTGIFEPYSGVKTSILILDKKLKKTRDYIFFAKLNNDGFSLTKKRTPIDKNDIPDIKSRIKKLDFSDETKLIKIKKEKIIQGNVRDHITENNQIESDYEIKILEDIADIKSGNSAPQDRKLFVNGKFPFIRTSDVGVIKKGKISASRDYLNDSGVENLKLFKKGSILFPKSGASTLLNHRVLMEIDAYVSSHLAIIKADNKLVLDEYLFFLLQTVDTKDLVANPSYPSLNLSEIGRIEIPIPELETQNQIVEELNSYQNIIYACKKILENYKPSINIESGWEMVELGALFENITKNIKPSKIDYNKFKVLGLEHIEKNTGYIDAEDEKYLEDVKSNKLVFEDNDILYGKLRPNLNKVFLSNFNGYCSTDFIVLRQKEKLDNLFYSSYFLSQKFNKSVLSTVTGARLPRTKYELIKKILIPKPSLEEQNQINEIITEERKLIENNKKLIQKFQNKISEKIDKILSN
jgi:type I restriction enzyme M protein